MDNDLTPAHTRADELHGSPVAQDQIIPLIPPYMAPPEGFPSGDVPHISP